MKTPSNTLDAPSSILDSSIGSLREEFHAGPRPDGATALDADAGARHIFGTFGVHWKIDGADSGGRFSVVHHPIAPRALVAPLHYHTREDEFSYVLTGKMGAILGDEVVTAGPGTWVFKPRGQWHTFWNAGDTPCEIIEIISPAGFEDFFRELRNVWFQPDKINKLAARYGHKLDFDSVPVLCARFGLNVDRVAN